MLKYAITISITLLAVAHQAHAFCQPGEVQSCFINGMEGIRICQDNARFGPCIASSPIAPSASCGATDILLPSTSTSSAAIVMVRGAHAGAPLLGGAPSDEIWRWLGPSVDLAPSV